MGLRNYPNYCSIRDKPILKVDVTYSVHKSAADDSPTFARPFQVILVPKFDKLWSSSDIVLQDSSTNLPHFEIICPCCLPTPKNFALLYVVEWGFIVTDRSIECVDAA